METGDSTTRAATPLSDYACLQIGGEDAESFLQGQLSNDLGVLPVGGGQLSTFNDPRGRVIALLRIFRTPNAFVAAMPGAVIQAVAARLRMFVMRSRVSIEPDRSWRLVGGAGRDIPQDPDLPAMQLPTPGSLWIRLQQDFGSVAVATDETWPVLEIRNGLPEVYAETASHFVPQMLRLDRLGAISFAKGCYVGQEVIARARYLGRIKRHTRLYRSADVGVRPGDPVILGSDKVGEVARVAENGEGRFVLAVVRDDADGPMTTAGGDLERLPDPPAFEGSEA